MTLPTRRAPFLILALLVLPAFVLAVRPAGAQWNGAQFRGDAVQAGFAFTDATTGYVTEIGVYADDQSYNVKGDGGPAQRLSAINVAIAQYDPTCVGDPTETGATEAGEGGGPVCFYRTLEGVLPGKDAAIGLPDDAFAVSNHQLDAAWLNTPLTVVEWTPDGETILQEIQISLTWSPTSDVYTIHENWLRHTPPFVETGHINAKQRDAVATGTITFDGTTYDLASASATIADFQEIRT